MFPPRSVANRWPAQTSISTSSLVATSRGSESSATETERVDPGTGDRLITIKSPERVDVGYEIRLGIIGAPGHEGELEEDDEDDM